MIYAIYHILKDFMICAIVYGNSENHHFVSIPKHNNIPELFMFLTRFGNIPQ
jgi:hypothetical protein